MKNRVCLVVCYFGKWPKYIDLFLKSCRFNPSIDFLLISDCGPLPNAPDNVEVVSTSLPALKRRIEERLRMKVAIDRPYKLCDFKTAYGIIFEDYLEKFEFWGCTDLDIVYGNIEKFIGDKLLDNNDVIAARPWYLTGFFFLFRNVDYLRRLYMQSKDYKKVYKNTHHFSFIECNFAWQQLRNGASIFEVDTQVESMTEVIRREEKNGLQVCFAEMARESVDWRPLLWNQGKLTEEDKEWLLFHFVVHKNHWAFSVPDWEQVPDAYYISRFGLWSQEASLIGPVRDIDWGGILQRGTRKVLDRLVRESSG